MMTERLGDAIQGYFINSLILTILKSNKNEWKILNPLRNSWIQFFLDLYFKEPPPHFLKDHNCHNPILTHKSAVLSLHSVYIISYFI
jgi:hypothetical protein